jgi:16S rRNA (guanine966-N2)-methyltransferase
MPDGSAMRIVGGALRGQRLVGKPARATRPTGDRVREAIASALHARGLMAGASVLDLFAGTGALGLEALSWGAEQLVAVDEDKRAVACVQQNARALGLTARVRAIELDLLGPVARVAAAVQRTGSAPFTLVFADPPYTLVQSAATLLQQLHSRGLLAPSSAIVLEHAHRQPPERPACFAELAAYRYGDTAIALWETIAEAADS